MCPEEYVGYENLIRFIEDRALQQLDGDIIEIGAYMGGGTVKLAGFARKYGKKVFAVDTFDPGVDRHAAGRVPPGGARRSAGTHDGDQHVLLQTAETNLRIKEALPWRRRKNRESAAC